MEDLLVKFGIVFGKRYTLKQRQRFLLSINEEFSELGYNTKFANNNRKNNAKAVNLFIGDIASATTIICTHHDTPLTVLWPNYRYYPLNGRRSFRAYSIATIIPAIIATIFAALAIYFFISNPDLGGNLRPFWIFAVVLVSFLLATLISKGLSNKYNINRNTAAMLAILHIAKNLDQQARQKTAFILLDKGCGDNSGAQMMQQALPTTLGKKLFIYLDCIGNGEELVIAHRENLQKDSDKLLKSFKGKQNAIVTELDDGQVQFTPTYFFDRCIIVTNGHYDTSGNIYINKVNSGSDKFADIETIEAVADMIVSSLNK